MKRTATPHTVRVWRTKDMECLIRPWRWRCTCQRWRPWSWEFHWTQGDALHKALAHVLHNSTPEQRAAFAKGVREL